MNTSNQSIYRKLISQNNNLNKSQTNQWIGDITADSAQRINQTMRTPKQQSQSKLIQRQKRKNSADVQNTQFVYQQGKIQSEQVTRFKRDNNQSPLTKLASSLYRRGHDSHLSQEPYSSYDRSPTQLIQDIFRGIGLSNYPVSKAYYSKQAEQNLCELLSNKSKLINYVKSLNQQLHHGDLPLEVQKHYEILISLLLQLSQTQLEIHFQPQQGLRLSFNRQQLHQKQLQIERLQRELEQKNKQTQKIVEEYQGVIRNFNDVIQKLVKQKKPVPNRSSGN